MANAMVYHGVLKQVNYGDYGKIPRYTMETMETMESMAIHGALKQGSQDKKYYVVLKQVNHGIPQFTIKGHGSLCNIM